MSEKRGKSDECGLILLGNSGVGKSFLANRLLDTDIFQTKFSPQSVTRETESIPIEFNGKKYVVYNIPGLIEADQMLINQNIQEIKKAFEMSSNSIVIFIFGQLAGRIQDEQVVAFNLLNAACNFQPESLLIFLNNINDEMSKGYEDNVRYLLTNLTGTAKDHIYFLNQVQTFDDRRHLHQVLWKAVTTCVPTDYKMRNITLAVKEIPQLTKESKKQQEELLASKNQMSPVKTNRSSAVPQTYEDQMLIDLDPIPRDSLAAEKNTSNPIQESCVCRNQLCNNDVTSNLNGDFGDILQKTTDSISISTDSIACPQCGTHRHHKYRRVEYGTYYCKHCCLHDRRPQ